MACPCKEGEKPQVGSLTWSWELSTELYCSSLAAVNTPLLGDAEHPAQHAHVLSLGINGSKSSGQSLEGDFYLQFT